MAKKKYIKGGSAMNYMKSQYDFDAERQKNVTHKLRIGELDFSEVATYLGLNSLKCLKLKFENQIFGRMKGYKSPTKKYKFVLEEDSDAYGAFYVSVYILFNAPETDDQIYARLSAKDESASLFDLFKRLKAKFEPEEFIKK